MAVPNPHLIRLVISLGLAASLIAPDSQGASLTATVLDADGHGVADTVVVAMPAAGPDKQRAVPASATLDQIDKAFVPHVLVIQTGTSVVFPNSDQVAHQVYSFSAAKRFSLPLYRGQPHPPVLFDRPGIVVLGCNIHDSMLAYIYVTDSPWFGMTDAAGAAQITLPPGNYMLQAWTPRLPKNSALPAQAVTVSASAPTTVAVTLRDRLRPAATDSRDLRLKDY